VSVGAVGLTVRTPAGRTLPDDVSFGLDQRSFLAIVGPSGSGKPTPLNVLTSCRAAEAGTVYYGPGLDAEHEELAPRIGFVGRQDVLHDPTRAVLAALLRGRRTGPLSDL